MAYSRLKISSEYRLHFQKQTSLSFAFRAGMIVEVRIHASDFHGLPFREKFAYPTQHGQIHAVTVHARVGLQMRLDRPAAFLGRLGKEAGGKEVGYGSDKAVIRDTPRRLFVRRRRQNENFFPARRRADRDRLVGQSYGKHVRDARKDVRHRLRAVAVSVRLDHRA